MKLLWLALLLIAVPLHAELYRTVGPDGKIIYTDRPAPGTQADRLKFGNVTRTTDWPYETKVAMQKYPLTLYTAPDCTAACDEARKLLDNRHVPFTEKSLKTLEEVELFKTSSGQALVPTLQIGSRYLPPSQSSNWIKEIDLVGYSKRAPYSPKPASAPAAPQP